jgi:hypothetical protein
MSATRTEPTRENDYHREFPDSDIKDQANRLNAIVTAYEASIGGRNGPAYLLRDAITSTEAFADRLREKAAEWGIPVSGS